MGYRVTYGDIFTALPRNRRILLPHICNNIGVWGKGFTSTLDRIWPDMGAGYKIWLKDVEEKERLGQIYTDFRADKNLIVCGMIAQAGVFGARNLKPIKYAALVTCMQQVVEIGNIEHISEIYCPKFGAGLARGNWMFIEELIKEIWVEQNFDVTVYNFGGLRR